MRVKLPVYGVPAQLMLLTWQKVMHAEPTRLLDKQVAADPELLAHWSAMLAGVAAADAVALTQALNAQVDGVAELDLSLLEIDSMLRSCARCRLHLRSPFADIHLPEVEGPQGHMTPEALIDVIYDWFATLEGLLLMALYPEWGDMG
jgi:hypothetical protein